MRIGGLVLASVLLAGGCSGKQADAPEDQPSLSASNDAGVGGTGVGSASQAATSDGASPDGQAAAAMGRKEEASNDLYEFAYEYPDQAGAIPGLRARLDAKLDETRKALIAESRDDRREAKKNDFPYHAHSSQTSWKVVTDLPGWLSLSSEFYVFSGGAHGMSGFDSLLWDKQADAARKPETLFTSEAALRSAIRRPFCSALDREREKRRGVPVQRGSDDMFSDCIDPLESTVILGSSNGKTFDRLGILVGPYAAGPYAEGTYEITLPVTSAVLGTVKPAYKDSFSIGN